ncbi:hypothetical protein QTP88_013839 [Uroleucon formosanum]
MSIVVNLKLGACDLADAERVRHKSPKPMCFQSVSIKRLCWRNHLMGFDHQMPLYYVRLSFQQYDNFGPFFYVLRHILDVSKRGTEISKATGVQLVLTYHLRRAVCMRRTLGRHRPSVLPEEKAGSRHFNTACTPFGQVNKIPPIYTRWESRTTKGGNKGYNIRITTAQPCGAEGFVIFPSSWPYPPLVLSAN